MQALDRLEDHVIPLPPVTCQIPASDIGANRYWEKSPDDQALIKAQAEVVPVYALPSHSFITHGKFHLTGRATDPDGDEFPVEKNKDFWFAIIAINETEALQIAQEWIADQYHAWDRHAEKPFYVWSRL